MGRTAHMARSCVCAWMPALHAEGLVDAVDADGMGRGSLIFREYTDSGKAFVMYRVDAYNLRLCQCWHIGQPAFYPAGCRVLLLQLLYRLAVAP